MSEAIQDILHINVYRRLRSDLKKYVLDPLEREIQEAERDDKLHDFIKQAEEAEKEIAAKSRRLRDLAVEQEELQQQQRLVSQELRRIATPSAQRHDDLVAGKERIEAALDSLKKDLEEAARSLPLILAGPLIGQLQSQLMEEADSGESQQLSAIREKVGQLEEQVFSGPPPLPPDAMLSQRQEIVLRARFNEAANAIFRLSRPSPKPKLHDIGEADRARILGRVAQAGGVQHEIYEYIDRRERLHADLASVKKQLEDTSENPEIPRLLEGAEGLNQKIGGLNKEQEGIQFDLRALQDRKNSVEREIQRCQRARAATTVKKRGVNLAHDAQEALQEFIRRLAPEKLKILKERFEEMYSNLRKAGEDPVASVSIDPETWVISLKDATGHPVKFGFSAGMKEMYALSLIWSLAKASGRDLPIMIDFPGGHLDAHNFNTLLDKFLPQAGHQVVVLSTDRELDRNAASKLAPHVARMYRLDWDPSKQTSTIHAGYFD